MFSSSREAVARADRSFWFSRTASSGILPNRNSTLKCPETVRSLRHESLLFSETYLVGLLEKYPHYSYLIITPLGEPLDRRRCACGVGLPVAGCWSSVQTDHLNLAGIQFQLREWRRLTRAQFLRPRPSCQLARRVRGPRGCSSRTAVVGLEVTCAWCFLRVIERATSPTLLLDRPAAQANLSGFIFNRWRTAGVDGPATDGKGLTSNSRRGLIPYTLRGCGLCRPSRGLSHAGVVARYRAGRCVSVNAVIAHTRRLPAAPPVCVSRITSARSSAGPAMPRVRRWHRQDVGVSARVQCEPPTPVRVLTQAVREHMKQSGRQTAYRNTFLIQIY